MSSSDCNRRRFLHRLGQLAVVVAAPPLLASCGGKSTALACDKGLRSGEAALRKSLKYVEISPHKEKHCGNCAFFSKGEGDSCGSCQIFSGPANPGGHCDSWSNVG